MHISEIKSTIFEKGSVITELYKNGYQVGKTSIKPFKEEMKQSNNIILFLDNENNIIGGQIGKYTYEKGLHVIMF